MEIVVDADRTEMTLVDGADFSRLRVRVRPGAAPWRQEPVGGAGDLARPGAACERLAIGRVGPSGSVLRDPGGIRRLAGRAGPDGPPGAQEGPGGPTWEDGFSGMVACAASKGWVAPDGAIEAHVVWSAA